MLLVISTLRPTIKTKPLYPIILLSQSCSLLILSSPVKA